MPAMPIEPGKVALVTGASCGIGAAVAERLARGGVERLASPEDIAAVVSFAGCRLDQRADAAGERGKRVGTAKAARAARKSHGAGVHGPYQFTRRQGTI